MLLGSLQAMPPDSSRRLRLKQNLSINRIKLLRYPCILQSLCRDYPDQVGPDSLLSPNGLTFLELLAFLTQWLRFPSALKPSSKSALSRWTLLVARAPSRFSSLQAGFCEGVTHLCCWLKHRSLVGQVWLHCVIFLSSWITVIEDPVSLPWAGYLR